LNIYTKKQQWKLLLFIMAIIIVGASLIYSNQLVNKIADEERAKIKIWADAVQNKANLVRLTDDFFEKIKVEERKKIEIWAEATNHLLEAGPSEDVTFYSKIITGNDNIPVVQIDENNNIMLARNVEFKKDSVKVLNNELFKEFSVHKPIEFVSGKKKYFIYYKDSKVFTELKSVLNDFIKSFISEVVLNSASVPVIVTDSSKKKIIETGNIDTLKIRDSVFLKKTLADMEGQNAPIEVTLANKEKSYIFYENSPLLTRLRYYPYVQFGIISIFLLIAYIMFSTSRNSEQNKVWAGMAKETAHQLGTPLSSLMAWIELLKLKGIEPELSSQIEKDVSRLETIAQRFSKIGSDPSLQNEDITIVVAEAIEYIKTRISNKINFITNFEANQNIMVPLSRHLFDWVIENLCKNAADSMGGTGTITIEINNSDPDYIIIDVADTGKGISKRKFRTIFNPGYTSKQRGWGLGLSLSQRIIKKNHGGKIFVKQSVINKGTTFRIMLRKEAGSSYFS
jgi:two-component system, sporulation sensor kinase D